LRGYVRDDLALLAAIRPDAVVGDHRLSLAISARLACIPYLAITNAYWSPYADPFTPLPDLPINRWVGLAMGQRLFDLVWPLAAAYHSLPLNRVSREYGLGGLGWDWRHPYTAADRTLYADASELVPVAGMPNTHSYLGPVQWSPAVALPSWWDELPADRPVIYATIGSSGQQRLLDRVLESLSGLPVTVVATSAGKPLSIGLPANARLLDFAPGDALAARASLVICNGGSLTVYQALAAGRPIVGIAAHMDQHLSMRYVEQAGVGTLIRADRLDHATLRATTEAMLADDRIRQRAQDMARFINAYTPVRHLSQQLDEVIGRAVH